MVRERSSTCWSMNPERRIGLSCCPQVVPQSDVCMRLVSSDLSLRAPSSDHKIPTHAGVGFRDRLHLNGGSDNGPVLRCVYQWDLLSAVTVPSYCGLVVRAGRCCGVACPLRKWTAATQDAVGVQSTTDNKVSGPNPDPRAAGLGTLQVPTPTPTP